MRGLEMTKIQADEDVPFAVTANPCVVCAPLGAAVAFAGVAGGMTILHGSQGCATYIRRYLISHFREPMDIASSSFTEESAVFGGASKLVQAYRNVSSKYHPRFVGMASTCLAETIGEDAARMRGLFEKSSATAGPDTSAGKSAPDDGIAKAFVSTASYRGDQREGFHAALRALVEALCPRPLPVSPPLPGRGQAGPLTSEQAGPLPHTDSLDLCIVPAMISAADLRWLKETSRAFALSQVLLSDWSDTLDGGPWQDERLLPPGGTPVEDIARSSEARLVLELGEERSASAATWLEDIHACPVERMGLPIGLKATDRFLACLATLSGKSIPKAIEDARKRLLDAYVDAHKVVSGKRVLVYGDKDLVEALARFLEEIGMDVVRGDERDFTKTEERCGKVDLLVGNSKGYKLARSRGVPLVRIGFPVHDRFGGARIRSFGYDGTLELFDRIANALIERAQEDNDVGYTYY